MDVNDFPYNFYNLICNPLNVPTCSKRRKLNWPSFGWIVFFSYYPLFGLVENFEITITSIFVHQKGYKKRSLVTNKRNKQQAGLLLTTYKETKKKNSKLTELIHHVLTQRYDFVVFFKKIVVHLTSFTLGSIKSIILS